MAKIEKYKDDFILLLVSGFIAVNQADEDSAVKLFNAAEKLNPKSTLPLIGMGYLHLHKLELTKCIKAFEDVLKKEPHNEMAKTFLGIAMTMTPNRVSEGEKLLADSGKSHDKQIKKLSDTALDFVDRFVKKSPTPVEGQKHKGK